MVFDSRSLAALINSTASSSSKRQFNLAGFHKCISSCFVTSGMLICFDIQPSTNRANVQL